MVDRSEWAEIRDRRMREPGAEEAYAAARLAYGLVSHQSGAAPTRFNDGVCPSDADDRFPPE